MRYSSALVLSTMAIGQAAAVNVRHASFHARRNVEAKRNANVDNVDWATVAYDLSGVDWSSVFNKATPTPVAEQPAPTSAAAEPTSAPAEAAYTPTPAATEEAEKPKETESSNAVVEAANDILDGVESFCSKLGISKVGVNSPTDNGKIWLGDDSKWKAEFVNDAASDLKLFCWEANGFSGMSLNVNQPAISINLAKGANQTISFGENVPSACAPAFDDTELALFGGIKNTWLEATFNSQGAFDVSRNVYMHGNNIHAQGSKCTSDMDTCVFQCSSDVDSCETGYELLNCNAGNGGGGGYDANMGGTGGGCAMGSDGERIVVTFT